MKILNHRKACLCILPRENRVWPCGTCTYTDKSLIEQIKKLDLTVRTTTRCQFIDSADIHFIHSSELVFFSTAYCIVKGEFSCFSTLSRSVPIRDTAGKMPAVVVDSLCVFRCSSARCTSDPNSVIRQSWGQICIIRRTKVAATWRTWKQVWDLKIA